VSRVSRGVKSFQEWEGLPGVSRSFQEFPGFPGVSRVSRVSRSFQEFPGVSRSPQGCRAARDRGADHAAQGGVVAQHRN